MKSISLLLNMNAAAEAILDAADGAQIKHTVNALGNSSSLWRA